MFSRQQRLSSASLQGILLKGRSFHSPHFSVIVAKNLVQGYKIAVIVSKKIEKRSVYRNKLRRQIRSKIKAYLEKRKILSGVGMVVLVNMGWVGPFPVTFKEEIEQLLLKTKVVI